MKINKENNTVTFDANERMIQILELSQVMNEVDIDRQFNSFIEDIARRTLRSSLRNSEDQNVRTYIRDDHFNASRNTEDNIRRWSIRKSGSPYQILVAFFATQTESNNCALRSKMLDYFLNHYSSSIPEGNMPIEDKFKNRFRMMCTNARGGYGQIFVYEQETDLVHLSPTYESEVMKYKNEFTL